MNRPIRTMAIGCLVLFLALMINATYLQYVAADRLGDDPRNRRVVEAAFARERGAILVGRDPVAESVPSDGRFAHLRTYPEPLRYAHATGYFSFAYGHTGVERSQNSILSGNDPRLFVARLVDLLGNSDPQGGSVQLTLNRRAQNAAFDALRALGSNTKGAAVAIEPATGRILAMVSTPTFDPNRLASHDLGAAREAWAEYDGDAAEPLLNRAIQTRMPPGSTFKLVTAAAALESGTYADAQASVRGGRTFQLPQSSAVVGNHDGGNCGGDQITMTRAMQVSCNVTFLALADELGTDAMRAQAEAFGFNGTTLEDLPLQATSAFPSDLDAPQTAMSGIGQSSVSATPLQMAMVAAGIANSGIVMRPYVVDEVRTPDLDVLDKTEPRELSRAVSPRTAAELTSMLVATVDSGTATPARISGVQVAGKTGTAQRGEGQLPIAWFVSFAPADNPQIAVAVMIEDAGVQRSEIAGGRLAGPVARAIMEAVINVG
ncbi:peptidoglycan D,D-transpeptidase FtsI family protein [Nocardioides limicola]|uniref:peptidoglycan D,D-transpeptidase FtsI family protein n=1 Tax=Nocardioides limicola TaxID=2803368 RepID=UPI00193BF87F|nr:penicillin-binding protein 2 [Nocardioides sp. DJM-14]